MPPKKEKDGCGCGCASVPISLILVLFGLGLWGFTNLDKLDPKRFSLENIGNLLADNQQPDTSNSPRIAPPHLTPSPRKHAPVVITPTPQLRPARKTAGNPQASLVPSPSRKSPSLPAAWNKKEIRGIYLSRYQATNNASEQTIRERVRHYRKQGMNTIMHGVWGNGCTMYHSDVMKQTFGYSSCLNQFQGQWLNWLIDEAHKQGMQVHAYFERGIKIDENSLIFDKAVVNRWLVPGIDKTYPGIDQYVLDVELPEVSNFFRRISVEFVQKYPQIDAIQWDDYLGYYAGLPGKVDRTTRLTNFVRQMRSEVKKANPSVSFDLCHHNPYWGKRYFAADWQNWNVDRVFIQAYNNANFDQEVGYAEKYAGVAITDKQLQHLKRLIDNRKIKGILVFPASGKPEAAAGLVNRVIANRN